MSDDKKISQFEEKLIVDDNDYTVIVDVTTNTTKRAKKSQFKGDKGDTYRYRTKW